MGKEDVIKAHHNMHNLNAIYNKRIANEESLNRSKDLITLKELAPVENNYKTELCRTWIEKNFCPYGEKCRFAHGKKDLHEKYVNTKNFKQKECNSFYKKKGFCLYGSRCMFRHEERKLNEISRTYYPFLLNRQSNIQHMNLENLENSHLFDNARILHLNQSSENNNKNTEHKHSLPIFEQFHNNCNNKQNTPTNSRNAKHFTLNNSIITNAPKTPCGPYNNNAPDPVNIFSLKSNHGFSKILDSYM